MLLQIGWLHVHGILYLAQIYDDANCERKRNEEPEKMNNEWKIDYCSMTQNEFNFFLFFPLLLLKLCSATAQCQKCSIECDQSRVQEQREFSSFSRENLSRFSINSNLIYHSPLLNIVHFLSFHFSFFFVSEVRFLFFPSYLLFQKRCICGYTKFSSKRLHYITSYSATMYVIK